MYIYVTLYMNNDNLFFISINSFSVIQTKDVTGVYWCFRTSFFKKWKIRETFANEVTISTFDSIIQKIRYLQLSFYGLYLES